jgi:hypothetical protein
VIITNVLAALVFSLDLLDKLVQNRLAFPLESYWVLSEKHTIYEPYKCSEPDIAQMPQLAVVMTSSKDTTFNPSS